MDLYLKSTIEEIRHQHNFHLSKSLGQNFITDRGVLKKIIDGAGISEEDLVIEIGPGIGTLTAEAAKTAAKVIAVEVDKKLIPILEKTLAEYDNIEIVNNDILKTDINELIDSSLRVGEFKGRVRILGNLPYYITTPIIMKLLESGVKADSITIMMQKEVADRICSDPGSRNYGAISVAVQYYCETAKIADVPRDVFVPVPKVDSAIINLKFRKTAPAEVKDRKLFFECVKAGFGKRRKTLLNSLTGLRGLDKDKIRLVLTDAGIEPSRRAETLSIAEFASVANIIVEMISKGNQTGK